jgi:catalase
MAEKRRETWSTAGGIAVPDNQKTLTADECGPVLVQDCRLEKHAHFDRQVIPERRVHAKGPGA